MKEIIAVINQKGGVAKSTTAQAIGQGLYLKGYKVLFVDLDAQGNLSYSLITQPYKTTLLEVLTGKAKAKDAIVITDTGDVLPSSQNLSGADLIMTETGKEFRLKEGLEPLKKLYDYIIIDTPPALGILTINALTACTGVIIPSQADIYSIQGIDQLNNTINTVKKYCNKDLQIKGIVLTRYSKRAILTKDIAEFLEALANTYKTKVYKTRIREAIAVKEAQTKKTCLFTYAPKSTAAIDYMSLIDEILNS